MRKVVLTALLAGLTLAILVGAQSLSAGHGKSRLEADTLNGWQEVAPSPPATSNAGLASKGSGEFKAEVDDDHQTVQWSLTYTGLASPATVAHIHFGNRYLSGGVSVFFCGGGPLNHVQPPCPPGTGDVASLSGTWTPADIAGPNAQGIAPGEWEDFVRALRAGMTYANVHNATFPAGEIRAQINNKDQRQPDEP